MYCLDVKPRMKKKEIIFWLDEYDELDEDTYYVPLIRDGKQSTSIECFILVCSIYIICVLMYKLLI